MKIDIKNIIIQYLEYYPEEKEKLAQLLKLVNDNTNNSSNLFNRKNFQGHITASGFIYSIKERKLLLLEHKALKRFLQPGGHVELVDSEIIDTAKREIFEETGLKNLDIVSVSDDINIPFDINTHFISANMKKEEDEHYHHDFRYLFTIDKIKHVKLEYNESTGYKWISIENLKNDEYFSYIIKKIDTLIKSNEKIKKISK